MMRSKEEIAKEIKDSNVRLEDVEKVYEFMSTVVKKFGTFIKSVAVFGSFARKSEEASSDVDLAVIVDDSFVPLDKALFVAFQAEMNVLMRKYPKLHLNVITISKFWDSVRRGDPVTIQILRGGIPIYDLGFFAPVKRLLVQGKIRPTEESINATLSRAFAALNGYSGAVLGAVHALYWATVEASQAAIMSHGKVPGSPKEVSSILEQTLVGEHVLVKSDLSTYEKLFELEKKIEKGEVNSVEPEMLEELHRKAVEFVGKIDGWINRENVKRALGEK
jgi:predicted nucleotidyltransferase